MIVKYENLPKGLAFFLSIFVLFGLSEVAYAHVEPDMPDSVAEVEYLMLLDMKPGDIETRYKLGMVYYRQKKYEEAADQLISVVKKDPDHFHAYEGLGQIKTALNDHKGAIELFKSAINIKPEDNHIYYYLGMAYESAGMFVEAAGAYNTALKNHESIPQTSRDGHYANDLARFQKAIKLLDETNHAK